MREEDFHKQTTIPDLTEGSRPGPLPNKIGPYKIESLLNKGGMSYLYLGLHPGTTQPIVIKVLSPKFIANQEMVARFLKEAQIIGITDHPNIVKLYGQGAWEKGLYIAMEFIRGISLRQFIQQKSLSHKRALEIILQVAYALCHLHTHGVIHRDLKPENILITESGEIKVIDFGIAQLQGDGPETHSKNRRIIGTPVYMSPEQKENPLSVSYPSDIYSLGIIAYELILGRLSHGVIHLSLLPKNLRVLIKKALESDPKTRYQDIVDFITDISAALKSWETQPSESKEGLSQEILDLIQQTRAILIPQKLPRWPQVEIGIAVQEGMSLSGFYLDFFHLPENRFCLILAEPNEPGVVSLLHGSILRGMVRMAIQHSFHNGKKGLHPIKMLSGLSHALFEDPMHQKFSLSFLLLNPDKDTLSFVSCDFCKLIAILEGSKKARILSTPNPLLGADPNATILETADNWHSGDTLILTTFDKSEETPNAEELLLSPQPQAEKFLQRLSSQKTTPSKRQSAVLSLHRIF
jgi:serine/threonine protein kinase